MGAEVINGAQSPLNTTLPAQDLMICADEAWLRQALLNSILHGRKNAPGAKPITIAVSRTAGHARIDIGNAAQVGVDDNDDDMNGMIDPFLQGELGLNRGTHGLGLELPIAKAIVEAHDGILRYHATPGAFRVLIHLPTNLAS
jgi:signal transduction histidine kinase